jgi:hypothetical protein
MICKPLLHVSSLSVLSGRQSLIHKDGTMDDPIIYHLLKNVLKCDQNSRSTIISI